MSEVEYISNRDQAIFDQSCTKLRKPADKCPRCCEKENSLEQGESLSQQHTEIPKVSEDIPKIANAPGKPNELRQPPPGVGYGYCQTVPTAPKAGTRSDWRLLLVYMV